MSGHTPTPWVACDDAILADDGCIEVCIVPLQDGMNPTEWQANMRLIAAAPDLLEALKRALDWLASYPGGCARDGYDEARAAIAKAEGLAKVDALATKART